MKAKYWFIARGNLSSKECLNNIMNKFKIDDYTTKVSFVNIEKNFNSVSDAKKFSTQFTKWCWKSAGRWHNEADCTVSGIQKFVNDNWEDVEDE